MFRSLCTRYAAVMIGLVVAVALVLTAAQLFGFRASVQQLSEAGFRAMSGELQRLTRERGEAITAFLSQALVNPLHDLDMLAMFELLREIKALPGVDQALVFGPKGNIVHDGIESIPSYSRPLHDRARLAEVLAGRKSVVRSDGESMYITHPIWIGDEPLGGVRLRLSLQRVRQETEAMDQELKRLARAGMTRTGESVVVITLLLVAVALVLAIAIARRLARPLIHLAEQAALVGRGDYHIRVESSHLDEIGKLVSAFNRMVQDLDQTTVSRRFMENVIASMRDSLVVIDRGGRVDLANRAAGELFVGRGCQLQGSTFQELFPKEAREDVADAIDALRHYGRVQSLETECEGLDGRRIPVLLTGSPMLSDDLHDGNLVCIMQDVSERRETEAQLRFLAQYDQLTGLPNRALFQDRMQQALARAERNQCLGGLVFLDLDGFKYINDTLGHLVGDQVLRQVARRLREGLRKGDTVARLGGDEFIVIAEMLRHVEDAIQVVEGLLAVLKEPFQSEGRELFLTGSIGVTLFPVAAEDATTLLRQADTAMYRAKELGKNGWCLYERSMDHANTQRLELEAELRRAFSQDDLELYFQPLVKPASGRIVEVEALLRCRRPDSGVLAPADFLPVLEDMGLIVPVGDWVLRAACQQAAAWNSRGLGPLRVSVNLSMRQFENEDLERTVTGILEQTGLAPDALVLGITESTVMRDPQQVIDTLRALKTRGVRVAIDDFGSGLSSFSHLQRLDVDTLKIDRSLIEQVPANEDHSAIVRALIKMAHTLGKQVVLEGVETEAQIFFAQEQGVDLVQGFIFSQPLPLLEVEELMGIARREMETRRAV